MRTTYCLNNIENLSVFCRKAYKVNTFVFRLDFTKGIFMKYVLICLF